MRKTLNMILPNLQKGDVTSVVTAPMMKQFQAQVSSCHPVAYHRICLLEVKNLCCQKHQVFKKTSGSLLLINVYTLLYNKNEIFKIYIGFCPDGAGLGEGGSTERPQLHPPGKPRYHKQKWAAAETQYRKAISQEPGRMRRRSIIWVAP